VDRLRPHCYHGGRCARAQLWVSWTSTGVVSCVLALTLTFYVAFSRVYKYKLEYIRDKRYAAQHPDQFLVSGGNVVLMPPSKEEMSSVESSR
jgi:hypothetical protein